jgi:hypothetical protein
VSQGVSRDHGESVHQRLRLDGGWLGAWEEGFGVNGGRGGARRGPGWGCHCSTRRLGQSSIPPLCGL